MNSQNPGSSRGNEALIMDRQEAERTRKISEPLHVHPPQYCYGGRVGCYEQIVDRKS